MIIPAPTFLWNRVWPVDGGLLRLCSASENESRCTVRVKTDRGLENRYDCDEDPL